MIRRTIAAIFAVTALLVAAGVASADNCSNVSRPAGSLSSNPADFTTTGPVIKGNWVWLPSVGVPVAEWAFVAPENYLNSGGQEAWLLQNTPYCAAGGLVGYTGPRTLLHGIQSGCGAFG